MKLVKRLLITLLAVLTGAALIVAALNAAVLVRCAEFSVVSRIEGEIPGLDEGFVPDGSCKTADGLMICGYMTGGGASRVYMIREGGEISRTDFCYEDSTPYEKRVYGIAERDGLIYAACEDGIGIFIYNDILRGYETAEQYGLVDTGLTPKWLTVADGRLYVGSHDEARLYERRDDGRMHPLDSADTDTMLVYNFNDDKTYNLSHLPLYAFILPDGTEGLVHNSRGSALTLREENGDSRLVFFSYDVTLNYLLHTEGSLDSFFIPTGIMREESVTYEMALPPYAEDIEIIDDRLWILNSSAAKGRLIGRLTGGESIYSIELLDGYFD